MINITCCIIAISFLNSCKKDVKSGATPIPTVNNKCVIKGETTSLVGNEKNFEYQFDDKGNPTSVKVFNRYGGSVGTYQTASDQVVFNTTSDIGKPAKSILDYLNTDFFNSMLPAQAYLSIDDGDTLRVHYKTYFFFYNTKDQLITVGEQTDNIMGDWEYDLHISYNDQGNVTSLQYEWTTGPRDVGPPVTVSAYDDKPTPYAAVKGWPFFLINFNWDNYDPEPIITALSKNNPLNYTTGSGTNLFKRVMTYTYNDQGFPVERKNTNSNTNGDYTFVQTFSYNCN